MKVERAAGGLVVRRGPNGQEALLIEDAYGKVCFPKGHVELGETWEAAATREIREETGIEARILAPLGRVEYLVERGGETIRKQVRLFLLEAGDDLAEPVRQVEEIRGAWFLPWDEARTRHAKQGYNNWSWVFEKADVLWQWHVENWEERWRHSDASSAPAGLDWVWAGAEPLVERLVRAVQAELAVVAPDMLLPTEPTHAPVLPLQAEAQQDLRTVIEHTLLKPEASSLDIERLCDEAVTHQFHAVCVNPLYVPAAVAATIGRVTVCAVVGFPLGASMASAVAEEARQAVQAGANEVDMVLPVGAMREDDIWTVYRLVQAVEQVVHGTPGAVLKVIFENYYLSYSQVAMATLVSTAAGADFVKTSTGFAPSGARLADVALMHTAAGGRLGVKAAGGVRSQAEAIQFIRYGATRIGTSSGVTMVR